MSKWKDTKKKEEEESIPTLAEFEQGMKDELDDLQKAFRERAQKENQRFSEVCDTDYYFVVYFSNYNQMEEFCDKYKLDIEDLYIDGRQLSRNIGRALESKDSVFPKIQSFGKDYVSRAMTKEELQQHKKE